MIPKKEILETLNRYKNSNQSKYGIKRIGVFGSVSRGEEHEQSDVDVIVELEKQDLFYLIGIKQDLEEQLRLPVDIVSYREHMNPFLKKRIDKEASYV
ncbi:MAG: nucleotidyltransferase domain-containing protein [Candidatus Latescibacteria bacterium]|nr:nucleotidyltransferase domain-containing protein [Candidatus Latescibacterota bacterium]